MSTTTNQPATAMPPPATMELPEDSEDCLMQVLDAGEDLYGMFVAGDEDLYAHLAADEDSSQASFYSWMVPFPEDIEEVISQSLADPQQQQQPPALDADPCNYCSSFANMMLNTSSVDTPITDEAVASKSARNLTPTRSRDAKDPDAMME